MKKKFRNFLEHNRWLKWVPNSLTLCNSLCGFAAIVNLITADTASLSVFARSAWFILFAMIFDCLDGFTARILNACSMHGLQMDSLSDMVTFGVAPATTMCVIAKYCLPPQPGHFQYLHLVVWFCAAVYLGCAALRLATYNVHAILNKKSSDKFSGLPSPGAAAAICTTLIFFDKWKLNDPKLWMALSVYAAVLGFLMVCNIQYQHCGKWLTTVKRNKKRLLVVILLLAAACIRLQETAFLFVNLYVIWGILAAFLRLIGVMKKIEDEPSPEKLS